VLQGAGQCRAWAAWHVQHCSIKALTKWAAATSSAQVLVAIFRQTDLNLYDLMSDNSQVWEKKNTGKCEYAKVVEGHG
jgi:hypothetical protein